MRTGSPLLLAAMMLACGGAFAAERKLVEAPPPPQILDDAGSTSTLPNSTSVQSRGSLLYENHCTTCHTSALHIRERRSVRNLAQLNSLVTHWAQQQKLGWQAEEIADVTAYLNARHYKF